MAQVPAFHTSNEEDHKRSPVWHDNNQCRYGQRIKPMDRVAGMKGNKCLECTELDKQKK